MDVSVVKWLALIFFVGGIAILAEGAWSYSRAEDEYEEFAREFDPNRAEARYDPLYQNDEEQETTGKSLTGFMKFMFSGYSMIETGFAVLCIVSGVLVLIFGPRVVKSLWPDPPPTQRP